MCSLNVAVSLNRLLMIITSSGQELNTSLDLIFKRIKLIVVGVLFLFQINWKCPKTVLKEIPLWHCSLWRDSQAIYSLYSLYSNSHTFLFLIIKMMMTGYHDKAVINLPIKQKWYPINKKMIYSDFHWDLRVWLQQVTSLESEVSHRYLKDQVQIQVKWHED